MPYAKSTLKGDLFAIKKHISGNMGRAFDVSKLAYVEKARQGINNCLDADNKTRAMSLEDSLVLRPAEGGGWEVRAPHRTHHHVPSSDGVYLCVCVCLCFFSPGGSGRNQLLSNMQAIFTL